jgi:predicted ATPase
VIRPPDHRLRVFVSSTLRELAEERAAVRDVLERLRLSPVMFELGARPHPPRELYRAYLEQSQVFVGIYWQSYGWVAPGERISGLEDEYRLAGDRPRLVYIKEPAEEREPRLTELLAELKTDDVSYKGFRSAGELAELVANDVTVLIAERFEQASGPSGEQPNSTPPTPLSPIVGRERELAEVEDELAGGTRLLTITGPGGVGKTRLAVEAANAATDSFEDGPHYVPLESVGDQRLLLRAIADRIGARVEGSLDPAAAVADRFGDGSALLVLDNFEHLEGAAPDLVGLLERCPGLSALVTSRHALRVRGERGLKLAPLSVDPAGKGEPGPAVRLFAARAREASPSFALDAGNRGDVELLCRRLEGLPLALELAAAGIALFPPSALLERLDQRLDLAGRAPELPDRQRTLRAAIDWSHDLLGEEERAMFARLGVFAGDFTLTAAESVCGEGIASPAWALASLLDKSLIGAAENGAEGEPRFRMLATIRAYARERLGDRGELERLRRAHLAHFRELGELAQPYLCGPGQREWALRLDPDRADLRAAAATALDLGLAEDVIELAWDVVVFYFIRDAIEEPDSWLRRAAELGPVPDPVVAAKLDSLLTVTRIALGDFAAAPERLLTSLEVFRSRGMSFEAAVTLHQLAWVRYRLDGDPQAAVAALRESSALFEEIGHDWGVGLVEAMLGSVLLAGGDLSEAAAHNQRSLERSLRIENDPLIATALQQIAMVRVLDGRPADAVEPLREAARAIRAGRYRTEAASCLDALAGAAGGLDRPKDGARALFAARRVRDRIGLTPWPSASKLTGAFEVRLREAIGEPALERIRAADDDTDPFGLIDEVLAELP